MDDRHSESRCYQFGCFVLDVGHFQLLTDDGPLQMSPKAFEVLALLVERHGELVTKDELLALVWPGTVVEENNLARQISTLRKVLGDTRGHHEYIATIPGQGYRFVAPVVMVDCPAVDHPSLQDRRSRDGGRAPRASARRSWASWAAAVVIVPIMFVLWSERAPVGEVSSAAEAETGTLRRLTYGASLQHQPSWSPDGRRLVFASDVSGNSDLWIQDLDRSLPAPLTASPANEWQPAWSPDGRWIAYRSERGNGGLFLVPAEGGEPTQLTTFGHHPRWSPSSTRLLFSESILDGVKLMPWIVDLAGGAPAPVRPDVLGRIDAVHVAWRPGEDLLSVWGRRPDGRPLFLMMSPDDGAAPVESGIPDVALAELEDAGLRLGAFAWASPGELYFEGQSEDVSNLWRVPVDATTLAWLGAPSRVTLGPGISRDFALSSDGHHLAFSSVTERTRLWAFAFDVDGALADGTPLTSGGAGEYDAAAPRDGLRLSYRTVRNGRQQLWERSVSGGGERVLLAGNNWRGSSPRWGPDGRTLAYGRRGVGINLVDAETGIERLLTLPPHINMDLVPDDWSSDGATILAACRPEGRPYGICVVSINESSTLAGVRVIASAPGVSLICPRFSPNERWISFMTMDRRQAGVSRLYVMPVDGGDWVPVSSGGSYDDKPRWSADGQTLYYISDRDGGPLNLWGQSFDPERGVPVGAPFRATAFENPSRLVTNVPSRVEIAVSEDRVFLPLTDTAGDIWVLDLP